MGCCLFCCIKNKNLGSLVVPCGERTSVHPLICMLQIKIKMFLIVVRINPVHDLVIEKQLINQETKLKQPTYKF